MDELIRRAEDILRNEEETKLKGEWGIDPVPDEEMNQDDPTTVAGRGDQGAKGDGLWR